MVLSGINVYICAHILYCMNLKYDVTVTVWCLLPVEIHSSPDSINPHQEDVVFVYGRLSVYLNHAK